MTPDELGTLSEAEQQVWDPGRAALWLLALTFVGTIVFTFYPPVRGGAGATFHPCLYTLDLLLPIVNFGQETTFGVTGDAQCWPTP